MAYRCNSGLRRGKAECKGLCRAFPDTEFGPVAGIGPGRHVFSPGSGRVSNNSRKELAAKERKERKDGIRATVREVLGTKVRAPSVVQRGADSRMASARTLL